MIKHAWQNSPSSSNPPPSPGGRSGESKAKRANPLVDLIDTEKEYLELLSAIIRVRLPPALRYVNHVSQTRCSESSLRVVSRQLPSTRA